MVTNREIVSRINNQVRALTKDSEINNRFILFTAQNIASSYLAKKAKNFSLYRQDDLFTTIDCVEMEKSNIYECDIIQYRSCNKLMKSKNKLPGLIYTRFGSSIIEVSNIDGSEVFSKKTPTQYKNDAKRKGTQKQSYYTSNGHLYLPDSEIEVVRVVLITLDTYDANETSACSDCCDSAWDNEFICPPDLLEQVMRETLQQVLVAIQISVDENPNLDSNQKTQTA